MTELYKLSNQPELQSPSLIVGWSSDAGQLGLKVTDYLNRKLGGQPFCEIEPAEFFPLGGVAIENDLVLFPETRFYACPRNDLVVLRSTPPSCEWYRFLDLVLEIAQKYCHVKELYTIGGMISLGAHTAPRQLFGTINSAELKTTLSPYQITSDLDYETPPGQKPTLNSFLLWTAKRRNIPGANLWIPVPFYLVAVDDPTAQKKALGFLDRRLHLQIDFGELDEQIGRQNRSIAQMRTSLPEIDSYISKLESNIRLGEGENEKLVRQVEEFLRATRD